MMRSRDWIDTLAAAGREGQAAVLVTVASVRGSTPREPGARMVVTSDAIAGTIGGGQLEHKAIGIAREIVTSDRSASDRGASDRRVSDRRVCGHGADLRRFPLAASLGQCCGGVVTLFFDPVAPGARWVDGLAARHRAGVACVVVTPSRGDAQERRLLVDADCVEGSLGSAARDASAIVIALRMLATGAPTALAALGEGQLGGEQRGDEPRGDEHLGEGQYLFDVVEPPALHVVLFGAGHVGRALVGALAGVDCRIVWVDTRDDAVPGIVPANVECVATDTPEAEVAAAPAGAHFLVMTHSHPLDQVLTEAILRRDDFAYFGLIGSISKRRQFERRLRVAGVDPRRFARMTCPIGVAGITSKEPAAIAIAVAAEVLQSHERAQHAVRPRARCAVRPRASTAATGEG